MKLSDLFQQLGEFKTFQKGQLVFQQGEQDQHLYFVQSGLLKAFYLSEDGKEQVKSFLSANNVIGSLMSCYSNTVCSFNLVCLEATSLIQVPFTQVVQLSQQDQQLANELQHVLLTLAMKKEKREYELLCLPAEQRYQLLRQDMPELFEKVTQNDIAHYLGITNVALSRIKKRLTETS